MSTLKIVVIVLVILLLVCGGICAGVAYFVGIAAQKTAQVLSLQQDAMNASPAAIKAIQQSELAKEKLGEPLEIGVAVVNIEQVTNLKDRGNVPFVIPVKGPMGEGTAICRASEDAGRWKILELKLSVDGTSVDIPVVADEAPDLQFDVPKIGRPPSTFREWKIPGAAARKTAAEAGSSERDAVQPTACAPIPPGELS